MSLISPWRCEFPGLLALEAQGQTYLDSAATAQKPQAVIDALTGYLSAGVANVHRAQHLPGERATQAFEHARALAAQWLGAPTSDSIVFTRGSTESLNLLAYSLEAHFSAGDEIAISALEHHANLLPWQQLAHRAQLKLVILPITEAGDIDLDQALALIGPRTRLVALTACSNVIGRLQPLAPLLDHARTLGAITVVDAAQAAVHSRLNVQQLGCDFLVCSGHKLYGPDGIGLLYGRREALAQLKPWQFGGEMVLHADYHDAQFRPAPLGLEAGTPAVSAVIGLGAALTWLMTLDHTTVTAHEAALHAQLVEGLQKRPGVQLLGAPQLALASFSVADVHPADLSQLLSEQGVCVRGGHHCAMPLLRRLGLPGAVRVSLGLYNDSRDLERLFDALDAALEILQ